MVIISFAKAAEFGTQYNSAFVVCRNLHHVCERSSACKVVSREALYIFRFISHASSTPPCLVKRRKEKSTNAMCCIVHAFERHPREKCMCICLRRTSGREVFVCIACLSCLYCIAYLFCIACQPCRAEYSLLILENNWFEGRRLCTCMHRS